MSDLDKESVRITIRISGVAYEKLDELIKNGSYRNISDVIRSAILEFISNKFPPQNIGKLTVELPKNTMEQLSQLVEAGDAVSKEEEIRTAIREYLNRKFRELARARLDKEFFKGAESNES
jgi:Arc/MetJ-type ribon-helix-helix transcriptional regulator